jgi:hypothetical protein
MNSLVDTSHIQALDSAHFLHPFTDFKELNARGARVMTEAKDIYVWDSEGNRILDAMSGLWCVNVGYGRESIANAVRDQLIKLNYFAGAAGTKVTLIPDPTPVPVLAAAHFPSAPAFGSFLGSLVFEIRLSRDAGVGFQ